MPSYQATLKGRRIRGRVASAANIKASYERPERLRYAFEDEFVLLAWGADLGLAGTSTVAVPLYTLTDRQVLTGPRGAWEWQYRSRYQSGTVSKWLSEEEVWDSFTPLQIDVFHALWRHTKADIDAPGLNRHRRKGSETLSYARRRYAAFQYVGTQVGRPLEGADGVSRVVVGRVYGSQVPAWRVRYPDGDCEKLSRRDMTGGVVSCRDNQHKGGGSPQTADTGRRREAGGETPTRVGMRRGQRRAGGGGG